MQIANAPWSNMSITVTLGVRDSLYCVVCVLSIQCNPHMSHLHAGLQNDVTTKECAYIALSYCAWTSTFDLLVNLKSPFLPVLKPFPPINWNMYVWCYMALKFLPSHYTSGYIMLTTMEMSWHWIHDSRWNEWEFIFPLSFLLCKLMLLNGLSS